MTKKLVIILMSLLAIASKSEAQFNAAKVKRNTARIPFEEKNSFLKQAGKDEVWFYEHANYQGKKYVLGRGKYTLANLGMSANDFFSSALVPAHLTVVVYYDNDVQGNWMMLSPDNANYGYNADFTTINNYRYWQTPNGDPISGIANINDKISSICICDPSKDLVTIYADCDYKGTQMQLSALPNYNHNTMSNYKKNLMNQNYGWDLSNYQFNKKASSVQLSGMVQSVDYMRNDLGWTEGKSNTPCLTEVQVINRGKASGNFNDNLDAITIHLKLGTLKIY